MQSLRRELCRTWILASSTPTRREDVKAILNALSRPCFAQRQLDGGSEADGGARGFGTCNVIAESYEIGDEESEMRRARTSGQRRTLMILRQECRHGSISNHSNNVAMQTSF